MLRPSFENLFSMALLTGAMTNAEKRAHLAAGAYTRPLFQLNVEHFLWDTLVGVSLSVTKTAQAELIIGRVYKVSPCLAASAKSDMPTTTALATLVRRGRLTPG